MKRWQSILLLIGLVGLWLALCAYGQPAAPHLVDPPSVPGYNYYYFAADCTDKNGLKSDYSNEVWLETTNLPPLTVTLEWDKSPGTNVITNYTIYQGPDSRVYTQQVNVGLCLTGSVTILPKVWTRVVSFTCSNAPSAVFTNLVGPLYVRAKSWRVANQRWPTLLQGANSPKGPWSDLTGIITNADKPSLRMQVTKTLL